MQIKYRTVGLWKENSYCIEVGSEAWIIDPGDEFSVLDETFCTPDQTVLGIINTHGHFDHIGAVQNFKDKYHLKFFLHSMDKQILRQSNLYRRLAGDKSVHKTPAVDVFLDELHDVKLGEKPIVIHHTPGHTNGSVCFEIDRCLFSGDVVFKESIGRTDLPGGNADVLKQSVRYIVENFIGYTIYPGHGAPFVLNEAVAQNIKSLL